MIANRAPVRPVVAAVACAAWIAAPCGASAAGRKSRVAEPPLTYRSGGFYPEARGDVLVGADGAQRFDPFSFDLFGDAGDYDDGPRCTIRQRPFLPLVGHGFVRVCR